MKSILLALLLPLTPAASQVTLSAVLATALEVTTLEGQKVTLASLVGNGQPVVIDFWATWCSPCRKETPHLVELQEKYRGHGLIILGLTVEKYEKDLAKVKAYVEQERIPYRVAFASPEVYRLFRDSKMIGVPEVYVFGRDGHLIEAFHGYNPLTNRHIAAAVEKAAAQH